MASLGVVRQHEHQPYVPANCPHSKSPHHIFHKLDGGQDHLVFPLFWFLIFSWYRHGIYARRSQIMLLHLFHIHYEHWPYVSTNRRYCKTLCHKSRKYVGGWQYEHLPHVYADCPRCEFFINTSCKSWGWRLHTRTFYIPTQMECL